MDKEMMLGIYNTLNEVTVKGHDNLGRIVGVLNALRNSLNALEEAENNTNGQQQ